MQRIYDPYVVTLWLLFRASFEEILVRLGKFFFCTAGGRESCRSGDVSWVTSELVHRAVHRVVHRF